MDLYGGCSGFTHNVGPHKWGMFTIFCWGKKDQEKIPWDESEESRETDPESDLQPVSSDPQIHGDV